MTLILTSLSLLPLVMCLLEAEIFVKSDFAI